MARSRFPFFPHPPPASMDIEIEEPTEEQKLAAIRGQAVRMAAKAEFDTQIIAYLVTQEIPKEKARRMLPEIRELARPQMNRHFAAKRMIGWIFILAGAGIVGWGAVFSDQLVVSLVIGVIPLAVGINQIVKGRTPADSELGLPEPAGRDED